jgi:hypothetical protein
LSASKKETLLINILIAFEMLDQRLNSVGAKCAGGVSELRIEK